MSRYEKERKRNVFVKELFKKSVFFLMGKEVCVCFFFVTVKKEKVFVSQ